MGEESGWEMALPKCPRLNACSWLSVSRLEGYDAGAEELGCRGSLELDHGFPSLAPFPAGGMRFYFIQ